MYGESMPEKSTIRIAVPNVDESEKPDIVKFKKILQPPRFQKLFVEPVIQNNVRDDAREQNVDK